MNVDFVVLCQIEVEMKKCHFEICFLSYQKSKCQISYSLTVKLTHDYIRIAILGKCALIISIVHEGI